MKIESIGLDFAGKYFCGFKLKRRMHYGNDSH